MIPNPEIFGMTLNWYTFFPKLGIFVTILFALWYYYKKADFQLSLLQLIGFVCLLYVIMIGAGRLIGFMERYLRDGYYPELSFFFKGTEAGGFRWCGSLLGVLLCLPYLSKRLLKISAFNKLFDLLVLCFCVFTIFIKQACQFSGDGCYGVYTNLPWGMYYPYGIAPNILPVHPTPIYDSLFHLLFFLLLLRWDLSWKKRPGQTSKIYFIAVPVFYILLEIIRVNPVLAYGVTLPQVVYLLVLLLVIPVFKNLMKGEEYFNRLPEEHLFVGS